MFLKKEYKLKLPDCLKYYIGYRKNDTGMIPVEAGKYLLIVNNGVFENSFVGVV